ncbi:MAG: hypothetical protein NVS3B2_04600 [Ramlibacter sp.]
MTVHILHGDCRALLAGMAAESFHSCVCDPPAGISFMNRAWDHDLGGRSEWIGWMQGAAAECLRVCKPGAHALVWSLPRTSHWTATAWENAGWEVRDRISHLFGQGFPKSHDVAKGIDRAAGAVRTEVVGTKLGRPGMAKNGTNQRAGFDSAFGGAASGSLATDITAPATPAARAWEGWGTALKPACEDWWLMRKPLSGTVAANVLAHGCGGINVGACRVPTDTILSRNNNARPNENTYKGGVWQTGRFGTGDAVGGRWPANIMHDGSDEVEAAFGRFGERRGSKGTFHRRVKPDRTNSYVTDLTRETFGQGFGDTGTASRFFYCAKAGKDDRAGSDHPTVKPISLMRWLVRLVTPPGGHCLDPFAGSGTTGQACQAEGFDCTLIEQDAQSVADCQRRIGRASGCDSMLFDGVAP